jgi:hypothetical protein
MTMFHRFSRSITFVVAAAAALALACGKEADRSAETSANHQQPELSTTTAHGGTSSVLPALSTAPPAAGPVTPVRTDVVFSGSREETERFIAYYKSIPLTADQERLKVEALASIPAPCCSNNPLATCCCPCNMAKAAWGLSAWLIREKNYDAGQVRQATTNWLTAANPGGFSGDACDKGGCSRPIRENGCGGMNDQQVL